MLRKFSLMFLMVLSGCSVLDRRDFIEPEVLLTDLNFEDVTLLESVVVFTVRVENDNPYPIDLDGSRHKFYLNDTYIGKGKSDNGRTVPRLGEITYPVKVHLSNLSMLGKVQSIVNRGEVHYELENTLFVDRGFGGSRSFESSSEGRLASNDLLGPSNLR